MRRLILIPLFTVILALACSFALAEDAAPAAPADAALAATGGALAPDALEFLAADTSALTKQADAAYQAKDYLKAAEFYLQLLRYTPRDYDSIYNLACCYALLGDAGMAAKAAEAAYNAGFQDFWQFGEDPDFTGVRGQVVFDEMVKSLAAQRDAREKEYGELVYVPALSYIKCRVRLPENYDAAQPATLILGLHGFGDDCEHFGALAGRFAKQDFIFAIPEAPYPFDRGGAPGYSWWPWFDDKDPRGESGGRMTEDYVLAVLSELKAKYKVGDVYLMGFSQGCALTYLTGLHHPELFQGIICFGGWLQKDRVSLAQMEAAKGLRVFIGQGTEDNVIEPKAAYEARDILKLHGFDVTLAEFKGAHRVPEEIVRKAEEWLRPAK